MDICRFPMVNSKHKSLTQKAANVSNGIKNAMDQHLHSFIAISQQQQQQQQQQQKQQQESRSKIELGRSVGRSCSRRCFFSGRWNLNNRRLKITSFLAIFLVKLPTRKREREREREMERENERERASEPPTDLVFLCVLKR